MLKCHTVPSLSLGTACNCSSTEPPAQRLRRCPEADINIYLGMPFQRKLSNPAAHAVDQPRSGLDV